MYLVYSTNLCCYLVAKLCLILLRPCGLYPTRLLCQWDSPGKNTEWATYFLLRGVSQTQGPNLCLLHYKWILYC